jgi:integrase
LSAVDTTTAMGKRDFAIMKLASVIGLRSVDIFGIQMTDINWKKNEITIVQDKTNVSIILPLTPTVGNAIADYILYGRPKSDSPYLFLRHLKPHTKLMNLSGGSHVFTRYQKKSGLNHNPNDGKTFHAFRRTVGTNLVIAEIPLPTIYQILGHKSKNCTKQYIALNDDMLQICCLDISKFATKKEGLV